MKLSRKIFLAFFCLGLAVSYLRYDGNYRRWVFFQPGLRSKHKNIAEFPKQAWVRKVVDGDTVILDSGQHLRYLGIDTPETRQKRDQDWIEIDQIYGAQAAEYNRRLVEKKKVYLEYDVVKQDRYGRLLAYVFAGDVFVNAKMIEEGLALLDTRPPNVKYSSLLVKNIEAARRGKRGFWRDLDKEIVFSENAQKYLGKFKTVEGKVKNIYFSKQVISLNFGQNHKTDFSAVIFKENLKLFAQSGINPRTAYRNKKLRVTGKIKEYNGPEIVVSSPFQIEVVN